MTPTHLLALYQINLRGGGADYACGDCLAEATREHDGDVVSLARVALGHGNYCMWCGFGDDASVTL